MRQWVPFGYPLRPLKWSQRGSKIAIFEPHGIPFWGTIKTPYGFWWLYPVKWEVPWMVPIGYHLWPRSGHSKTPLKWPIFEKFCQKHGFCQNYTFHQKHGFWWKDLKNGHFKGFLILFRKSSKTHKGFRALIPKKEAYSKGIPLNPYKDSRVSLWRDLQNHPKWVVLEGPKSSKHPWGCFDDFCLILSHQNAKNDHFKVIFEQFWWLTFGIASKPIKGFEASSRKGRDEAMGTLRVPSATTKVVAERLKNSYFWASWHPILGYHQNPIWVLMVIPRKMGSAMDGTHRVPSVTT